MPEVCVHRSHRDAVPGRPRRLVSVPPLQAHVVSAARRWGAEAGAGRTV